nr:putative capsid [Marmot picobirnavirus]
MANSKPKMNKNNGKGSTSKGVKRDSSKSNATFSKRKYDRVRNNDFDGGYKSEDSNGRNDFSWYNRNPQLTEAAARIPFPYRPGMVLPMGSVKETGMSVTDSVNYFKAAGLIPSLLEIDFYPSVGYSDSINSPVSIAAREMYARVRSAFSGDLDADAPDFIMYLMALDSIHSYIASLKRLYGALNRFSSDNYSVPNSILRAYGLSDEQIKGLVTQKVNLWGYINYMIHAASKWRMPNVFPIFTRHSFMNENVYADDNSMQSQLYMFRQQGFYVYNQQTDPINNALQILNNDYFTMANIRNFGNMLLDKLASWQDAYTINGYLQRAYDNVPSFESQLIAEDYVVNPVFNEQMLDQIHNARSYPGYGQLGIMDIKADVNNAIIHKPNFTMIDETYSERMYLSPVLDLDSDTPTIENIVEATRLSTSILGELLDEKPGVFKITCGSELVTGFKFINVVVNPISNSTAYESSDTTPFFSFNYAQASLSNDISPEKVREDYKTFSIIAQISPFRKHPLLYLAMPNMDEGGGYPAFFCVGDVHNVTTFSPEQLKEINRVCLFSLFNTFA